MEDGLLTNRELASLIWIGLIVVAVVATSGFRSVVSLAGGLVRMFVESKLLKWFILYWLWIGLTIYLAAEIDLWNIDLIKPTIVWFLFASFGIIFGLNEVLRDEGHFRRAIISAMGLTALIEYYVGLQSFSFVNEFFLQPTLFVLVLLGQNVINSTPKLVSRLANQLLSIVGLVAIVYVAITVIERWREADPTGIALDFALPIWLTLSALAFLWLLSIYASYDMIYRRMGLVSDVTDRPQKLLRVASVAGLSRNRLRDLTGGNAGMRIGRTSTVGDTLAETKAVLQDASDRRSEERQANQRLLDNAGIRGVDTDGRQLDQREFIETRKALERLATAQMGHYRNSDRYRSDLLQMLQAGFKRDGLPEQNGIELHVASDGQSWYATRQTVTGWWFAIGAAEKPPDRWVYDDSRVPDGLSTRHGWSRFGGDDAAMNW